MYIDLVVMKQTSGDYWPQLQRGTKDHRIKPDFDRMTEQEDEEMAEQKEILKKMKDEINTTTQEEERFEDELGEIVTLVYQGIFHFLSFGAWAYILFRLVIAVVAAVGGGSGGDRHLIWDTVGGSVVVLQSGGWVEVANIWFGVVKGSLRHTVMQALGRTVLVWVLLVPFEALNGLACVGVVVGGWALSDVVRHSFYTSEVLEKICEFRTPRFLRWLRYTICPFFYLASQLAQIPVFLGAVEEVGPAFGRILTRFPGPMASLVPPQAAQVTLGLYALYAACCTYQVTVLSYKWQRKLVAKQE